MEEPPLLPRQIQHVLYCAVCTMPPEYCEFSSSVDDCKAWLKGKDADLYSKLYGLTGVFNRRHQVDMNVEVEKSMENVVIDDDKAAAASKNQDSKKKKKAATKNQVIIKRIERNKRKFVTSVGGLELFEIDLKKAAKSFASKFATGSSVTKNPQGLDEIVVQGDVQDELADFILSSFPTINEEDIVLK